MIIHSIPVMFNATEHVKTICTVLEKMRSALNGLLGFVPILDHPTYKIRVNIVGGHLWIEVAKKTATPGQEVWIGFIDGGALPP